MGGSNDASVLIVRVEMESQVARLPIAELMDHLLNSDQGTAASLIGRGHWSSFHKEGRAARPRLS